MEYIVIQAGGKGTRLGYLTKNKPKALTPIENLPMIFHLFHKYPNKRFIIIADYQKEVLRRYLECFAEVKYQVVDARGTGTCSGIKQALEFVPEDSPFMLVWSDLILPTEFQLPVEYADEVEKPQKDYIGISATFPCRWKYENGTFAEEKSVKQGAAGLFLMHDKSGIEDIPESGELMRWMQSKGMRFEEVSLAGTREFGLLEEYQKLEEMKSRSFNRIKIDGDLLIKEPVTQQGKELAALERAWYEKAGEYQIKGLPHIYNMSPLKMERIRGKNIYECELPFVKKSQILEKLIKLLDSLHETDQCEADSFSVREAYYNKTMKRLASIEDLVPFARERYVRVNGRNCRNVFFYRDRLEQALEKIKCEKFCFIHGDCTFSNLILREDGELALIDPRGYFGFTKLYGDKRYDWAKLYYSIAGNYDRFNLRKFVLDIGGQSVVNGEITGEIASDEVKLSIESNGWEDMTHAFFELTGVDEWEIKLLHAVIWLSLTTYAWQDYDSVCGAFYNGLYYLEEVL